jgi:hypothetical protein
MRERSGLDASAEAVRRRRGPEALANLWSGLVEQGTAILGAEATDGSLREIAIVLEKLRCGGALDLLGGATSALRQGRFEPGLRHSLMWVNLDRHP